MGGKNCDAQFERPQQVKSGECDNSSEAQFERPQRISNFYDGQREPRRGPMCLTAV